MCPSEPRTKTSNMHSIALFVSKPSICAELSLDVEASRCVPLEQDLCGLLLFAADGDSIFSVDVADENLAFSEFQCLSVAWAAAAAHASQLAKIAYVETEYSGGEGGQGAVVWEHGKVIAGPSFAQSGPINSAMRAIGV